MNERCGGQGCGSQGRSARLDVQRPGARIPWWISSTFLLVLACSGGSGAHDAEISSAPQPPLVRDSAGVTIVENSEPQWAPGSEWKVGALLTSLGVMEGDPAQEFYRVLDATRLSDGTVAVGNSSSGEIRFFNQDGTFIRTVGSTGGGPGEFRGANAIRALRRVPGDTLIAWDIYGQNVSVFAPDGRFVRSFRFEGPAQQHFFSGIFGDRSIQMLVYESTRENPSDALPEGVLRRSISLYHYGVDHSLSNSLKDIHGSDRFQARWGPSGMMSMDAPFGRTTSINVGGARTYIATGDSNEIQVFDPSGTMEGLIRRTLPPIEVTPEMVRLDRARRIEEESGELEEMSVEPRVMRMINELPYPPILPPYHLTKLDSEMNLWVEEFRVSADSPREWSVFDQEGVWLGRVTFPKTFRVFEIGPDYILGLSVDDLGVERVQVHGLLKN